MKKLLTASLVTLFAATIVNADVVLTLAEVGNNVVLSTTSGTLTTPTLEPLYNHETHGSLNPSLGFFGMGSTVGEGMSRYDNAASGPGSFGTGFTTTVSDSYSGTFFSINASSGRVSIDYKWVQDNAGSALTPGTATWNNTDLSALGATIGTYVWTLDNRFGNETVTLNVIPEPATLGLMALLGGGILTTRRIFRI